VDNRSRRQVALIALAVAGLFITRKVVDMDVKAAINDRNVQAFLKMIRRFESNGDYSVIFGGKHFSDFTQHPRIRVPFHNPRTKRDDYSTAAGAYQINFPTWLTIQAVAALPDFSQQSQDLAAVYLLKIRGALGYILDNDFENALRVASKTWASLPYTDSMQAHVSADAARGVYLESGGLSV